MKTDNEQLRKRLCGTFTALVTPFAKGKVDLAGYRRLIRFNLENGVDGLVACGTTGEAVTLTTEEYTTVVRTAVEEAAGQVPVIAGTGSNNTETAIRTTRRARELGVDACLVVTPYYNKPTQEGLYRHFRHIVEETDSPVVLYNVPSRTGCNLAPQTAARLAELDRVVALKEASGDLKQVCGAIERCRSKLNVLSGEDFLTYPLLAVGGHGVISVTANVVPAGFSQMVKAARDGQYEKARTLHYRYLDLNEALFIETNPVPAKTALHLMGMIQPDVRLPLCAMQKHNRKRLETVLEHHELI
jgi:4-hydroxy-tetrahydrodipicolinate synthase